MKKLSLLCFALSIYFCANARVCVNVSKCGGGANGYDKIFEQHTLTPGEDVHSLTCDDPGMKICKWTTEPPAVRVSQNEAEALVLEQLELGNFSGTIIIDETTFIDFSGSNSSCFNFSIKSNI